jgi:hypothetical protein
MGFVNYTTTGITREDLTRDCLQELLPVAGMRGSRGPCCACKRAWSNVSTGIEGILKSFFIALATVLRFRPGHQDRFLIATHRCSETVRYQILLT